MIICLSQTRDLAINAELQIHFDFVGQNMNFNRLIERRTFNTKNCKTFISYTDFKVFLSARGIRQNLGRSNSQINNLMKISIWEN